MVPECAQGHGGNRIMPGTFVGGSAKELACFALSTDTAAASLGLAAINSLLEIDRSRCVELNAADLLLRAGKGKDVSVVGHFPFVDELRKVTRNFWVMERWLRPGDRPEADAVEFLPRSDVVAISGTTLINHTLSHLLGLCPGRSLKLLLGPTTPLTEVLFDHGIDVVSGSLVVDEERVLASVGEGADFRHLKRSGGVQLLTMARDKRLLNDGKKD